MERSILGLPLVMAIAACGSQARPVDGAAPALPAPPIVETVSAADAGPISDAGEPEPKYDLVLAHGRVLDPASGRDGLFDVAITQGRIAKIAPAIAPDRAATVIDVTGLVVTPGLVDLHVHVFHGGDKDRYLARTKLAAPVDEIAPRSCTTTAVDAGSAGHKSFPVFEREVIAKATTRVLAFVNIVGEGMRGGRFEQDLGDMDARATAAAIEAHRRSIVGIKVAHYAGPGWEPIDRATAAARATGVPVMIDFGGHTPELSLSDLLLRKLQPGDVFTHVYADVRGRTAIVDARGQLRPYVREAHERGIVFDLGYGGASFVFSQATPAIAQGLSPDTISTDMHRTSLKGSMHDLIDVMSKLERLGIALPDLIRKTTVAPADVIHRPELGRLAEGAEADIAVLGVESGRFTFADTKGTTIEGTRHLTCEMTLRAGAVVWDAKGRAAGRR